MDKKLLVLIAFLTLLSPDGGHAEDVPAPDPTLPSAFAEPSQSAKQEPTVVTNGKILRITVYREPDLSGGFKVDDTGHIAFPLIGNIYVEGRTPAEILEEITQSLKKFLINPQVSLTVERDPSAKEVPTAEGATAALPSITVLGEVRQPGTVDFSETLTLSKLIAESGGFTPTSDTGKIKVIRQVEGQQQLAVFSMEKIENGEVVDPTLQPGDKIVVPKEEKDVNTVAILGEVRAAGMYEVTPGITLMRIIAKAGGFTPTAATSKVRVVRQVEGEKKVYVYNAAVIINGQSDDPEVKPGDMVFVPETFF